MLNSTKNMGIYLPKKGFTIIEIIVVFLIILAVTFLTLPKNLEATKQAKFISQWGRKYSELEYMFSVIKAQQNENLTKEFQMKNGNNLGNCIIPNLFKPYLRITSVLQNPDYKQYYMSKQIVNPGDKYSFNIYYLSDSNEIISLKWINSNCQDNEICALMAFDLNGIGLPNRWGYDIFGLNVYNNKIEPFGEEVSSDLQKDDCSKIGSGIYCSYYYLIGGKFD